MVRHRAGPNSCFRLAIACNLLRHDGVEIGRQSYLGRAG